MKDVPQIGWTDFMLQARSGQFETDLKDERFQEYHGVLTPKAIIRCYGEVGNDVNKALIVGAHLRVQAAIKATLAKFTESPKLARMAQVVLDLGPALRPNGFPPNCSCVDLIVARLPFRVLRWDGETRLMFSLHESRTALTQGENGPKLLWPARTAENASFWPLRTFAEALVVGLFIHFAKETAYAAKAR